MLNNIVSAMSNVDALLTFAEEVEAGLMVMGAFARSRISNVLQGLRHRRDHRTNEDPHLRAALRHELAGRRSRRQTRHAAVVGRPVRRATCSDRGTAAVPRPLLGEQPQQADPGARRGRAGGRLPGRAAARRRPRCCFETGRDYVSVHGAAGSLFAISGGIYLRGALAGTPLVNTAFLAVGALLASVIGTTGASALLIRPLLRANERRQRARHLVVFFIFIVANGAGLLTPLGDPPLFLGFLRGVPFTWTLRLAPPWALVNGALLVAFASSTWRHSLDARRPRAGSCAAGAASRCGSRAGSTCCGCSAWSRSCS